jgi:hypothetical protein
MSWPGGLKEMNHEAAPKQQERVSSPLRDSGAVYGCGLALLSVPVTAMGLRHEFGIFSIILVAECALGSFASAFITYRATNKRFKRPLLRVSVVTATSTALAFIFSAILIVVSALLPNSLSVALNMDSIVKGLAVIPLAFLVALELGVLKFGASALLLTLFWSSLYIVQIPVTASAEGRLSCKAPKRD